MPRTAPTRCLPLCGSCAAENKQRSDRAAPVPYLPTSALWGAAASEGGGQLQQSVEGHPQGGQLGCGPPAGAMLTNWQLAHR
jgi:hypothetical protein